MRADMEQMRLEMQQLRPLVPLVQRINQELDLAVSVPPAAPIDTYVVRLAGLKKAAGSAKPAAKLERENAALKETNERLRRAAIPKSSILTNFQVIFSIFLPHFLTMAAYNVRMAANNVH